MKYNIKFKNKVTLNCVEICDEETDTIEDNEVTFNQNDIVKVNEFLKYYLNNTLHYDFQFGDGTMAFCINSNLFTIIEN